MSSCVTKAAVMLHAATHACSHIDGRAAQGTAWAAIWLHPCNAELEDIRPVYNTSFTGTDLPPDLSKC